MTDTIPTAAGQLEHVDPQKLIIGDNVRLDAKLDSAFQASIAGHGVLMPITVVRDDAGANLFVRDGQRRVLAAIRAGLATIPAYVLPSAATDFRAWEVERLTTQIVLNDQRAPLTEAQRARGIQGMLDAGVSVAKAAKLLSAKKSVVESAKAAGGCQAGMDALDSGQLTLEQAAVLAEFDDDPEAVAQLIATPTARFEHRVSQLRQQRESEAAFAEATATYQAQGVTVLEDYPNWRDLSCVGMRYLCTHDGDSVDESMVVPGPLWAVVLGEEPGYFDAVTGETVDEDELDPTTQWRPNAEPDEGLRHYNTVVERTVIGADWFCLDYSAAGLTLAPALAELAQRATAGGGDGDGQNAETARDAAADEEVRAEAERTARRMVLALNKLGDAAIPVRRAWIATNLLSRKTLPKGSAAFVAGALLNDPQLICDQRIYPVAAELLGLSATDHGSLSAVQAHLATATDNRAQVLTLAMVLAGLEFRCPKDAWRSGGAHPWRNGLSSGDYLAFLASHGYVLADIESVIAGHVSAADLFATTTAPSHHSDEP
ncbi:MAG: ParB family transcriptional regulator, chromosome partitioning protein [Actinomycetota bacterium]|nr:ParB family transcriptional regulator, chromosome partitioning protein [Actinomycetota bacterium]